MGKRGQLIPLQIYTLGVVTFSLGLLPNRRWPGCSLPALQAGLDLQQQTGQ
tara:strand:+ start:574 stop:726 length:153 start_codon:yes stop_codon:yes gene_type:complete